MGSWDPRCGKREVGGAVKASRLCGDYRPAPRNGLGVLLADPAPWCCETAYHSFQQDNPAKPWVCDSGANGVIVPRGDRSNAIIEPLLTDQWFVKIAPLAAPAIAAVENGDIQFVPQQYENTYFAWMRDIKDWCISRQQWWGHRVPAFYDEHGNVYVAKDETTARSKYHLADDLALAEDDDVLETWFPCCKSIGTFPSCHRCQKTCLPGPPTHCGRPASRTVRRAAARQWS